MTKQEQLVAIEMEIRNLNARIENAEPDPLIFETEWVVFRLEQTLDRLQREGRGKRSATRLTR